MREHPYRHKFDPLRYSRFYRLSCVSESQVQSDVVGALQIMGIPAAVVDAGAAKLRGRAIGALNRAGASRAVIQAVNKGKTGAGVAGLTDVVGCLPGGRALFLEIKAPQWLMVSPKTKKLVQKRPAGEPKPAQLSFMDTMAEAGALVGVVWALCDLTEILEGQNVPLETIKNPPSMGHIRR